MQIVNTAATHKVSSVALLLSYRSKHEVHVRRLFDRHLFLLVLKQSARRCTASRHVLDDRGSFLAARLVTQGTYRKNVANRYFPRW